MRTISLRSAQEFRTEDALIVNVKVTSSVHSGEDLFDILEKKENAFETKLKALLADKNLTCTSVVLGRGLIPRMAKNSVQYCNIARYLNIDIGEDGIPEWPGDWGGNLHLFREDIKIDKIKKVSVLFCFVCGSYLNISIVHTYN